MAKIPFTKFKCKLNIEEKNIKIGEEEISIKQYLPIQEKLDLIGRVIMLSHEQEVNYSNPVKAKTIFELEIVFNYTNISFTDKQKEDMPKLYDLLASSGIIANILSNIPTEELGMLETGLQNTLTSVYAYQNSVLGVLDTIKTDYSNTEFDLKEMQDVLSSQDLTVVKDIITKLG